MYQLHPNNAQLLLPQELCLPWCGLRFCLRLRDVSMHDGRDNGRFIDSRYSVYDNVTDKIWDTINKGVSISKF
jgi:hypothetical protein